MLEPVDKVLAFCGTVAGSLATWIYFLYQSKREEALQIQNLEMVKINSELRQRLSDAENPCIAYAGVEGLVTEIGKVYHSNYSPQEGVILKTTLVEHKSKRTQGIWSDVKKNIVDSLHVAPFVLSDPDNSGNTIFVEDPAEAECLLYDLDMTHHEFIPHKSSPVQAGLDRLFGEVCQGYEKTEEMLLVGTSLLGIGEIFLDKGKGKLKIRPPQMGDKKYFLTTLSRAQLVKSFHSRATVFKVLCIMFGVTAASLLGYVLWKIARRYLELRKTQQELEEIRWEALRRRGQGRSESSRGRSSQDSEESCVVCLNNPREVITLECGHIAMCSDCALVLPKPQQCPVCREVIQRFVPVYRP